MGLGLALASVLVSRLPASHVTVRMVDGRTPAQASASTGYIGSLKGGTSAVELAPMTERQQPSGATWAAPITMVVSQTPRVREMGDLRFDENVLRGVPPNQGERRITLSFNAFPAAWTRGAMQSSSALD